MDNNASKQFASDIKIAKGLGASGGGLAHWWYQRLTAVFLIALVTWFAIFIPSATSSGYEHFIQKLHHPCNISMFAIFSIISFYHAALGMQVIIEDYVHCKIWRYTLIGFIKIFAFLTVVDFIIALLRVMTL